MGVVLKNALVSLHAILSMCVAVKKKVEHDTGHGIGHFNVKADVFLFLQDIIYMYVNQV